jgi:NAD(P)-dependent dehydrogenase (short-subunit alcohol dehydrogenase family)
MRRCSSSAPNVTTIQADASKLEDLDRVADAVRSAKGKVDVVVSNAALVEQVPLPEITPDHYDRTFTLNAKAPPVFRAEDAADDG